MVEEYNEDMTTPLMVKDNTPVSIQELNILNRAKDLEELGRLVTEDKFHVIEKTKNFKEFQRQENFRIIKKLAKVCCFCFIFMIVELVGGYIAGSLAIMTDAAHLLSDLSGFFISIISLYIALRPANNKLTYGYHRAEIIGSVVSISIIWILTGYLIIQAIHRLLNPQPINGLVMFCIACLGLTFNLIMARILMSDDEITNKFEEDSDKEIELVKNKTPEKVVVTGSGHFKKIDITENEKVQEDEDKEENVVLRSTYIHILGDTIQSLGVVVASSLIYFLQDNHPLIVRVDPICTFIFGIIVLSTSIPITFDLMNVLMESAPQNINQEILMEEFRAIPNVVDLHDIHIWCLTRGKIALTAHFVSKNPQKTLELSTEICKRHGIFHSTIQVEDYTQRRRASFKICTHINDNQIH